uniref:Predicted protein n=1 Tax=Physcomitrium patens TaxID=3218 RepID=A9U873_PHYPA
MWANCGAGCAARPPGQSPPRRSLPWHRGPHDGLGLPVRDRPHGPGRRRPVCAGRAGLRGGLQGHARGQHRHRRAADGGRLPVLHLCGHVRAAAVAGHSRRRAGHGAAGRADRAHHDPAAAGRAADLGVHGHRGPGLRAGGPGGADLDGRPAPPARVHAHAARDDRRGLSRAQGGLGRSCGRGLHRGRAAGVPLLAWRRGPARHGQRPGSGLFGGHQRAARVLAGLGGVGHDRGGLGNHRRLHRRHLVEHGRVRPVGAGGRHRGRAGQRAGRPGRRPVHRPGGGAGRRLPGRRVQAAGHLHRAGRGADAQALRPVRHARDRAALDSFRKTAACA